MNEMCAFCSSDNSDGALYNIPCIWDEYSELLVWVIIKTNNSLTQLLRNGDSHPSADWLVNHYELKQLLIHVFTVYVAMKAVQ